MEEPSKLFWKDNHKTKLSDKQCVKVVCFVLRVVHMHGKVTDQSHL